MPAHRLQDMGVEVDHQGHTRGLSGVWLVFFTTKVTRTLFFMLFFSFMARAFHVRYGYAIEGTQFMVSFVSLASFTRPLLGYLSDTRPLARSRRRSYTLLGVACLGLATILLFPAHPVTAPGIAFLVSAMVVYGLGESLSDVALDALLLDIGIGNPRVKDRGRIFMRLGATTGTVIAYLAGALLVDVAWEGFIAVTGVAVVITSMFAWRLEESPVTRGEILRRIKATGGAVEPEVHGGNAPAGRDPGGAASTGERQPASWLARLPYKRLLLVIALIVSIPSLADGLTNAMLEAHVIDTLGEQGFTYFGAEFISAIIATGLLVVLVAILPRQGVMAWIWLFTLPALGLFNIAVASWIETLAGYTAWNVAAFTSGYLNVLVVDRMLMDVVRGEQRGWTFQVFILFMSAAAFAGGILGSMVAGTLGPTSLFYVTAVTWFGSMAFLPLVIPFSKAGGIATNRTCGDCYFLAPEKPTE
ncbi:hypothetical protein GF325_02575 [Candidatus Bathyarchaeota archaeon]|nr:hypothetical protein [Candidatus Bathyarchaeota archaeon]